MKAHQLLLALPVASALVLTEQSVFDKLRKFKNSGKELTYSTQNVLDKAFGRVAETVKTTSDDVYHKIHKAGCDVDSWLEGAPLSEDPPHRGPPQHGDPHHRVPKPPHHKDPHHDHPKPNHTLYELISKSKYTTKLAKWIDEYEDIVDALNSTKSNFTVFAPTDEAFAKIPDHGKKPSKEFLKTVLQYHVSDEFLTAGGVLHSYTIPTLYKPEKLGHAQRLTVRVTLKGPTLNFYSRIVATNIFATNGIIHGVDSILVPPPKVATILDILPGEFSTLELGLTKTGLWEKIQNADDYPHEGGTFFAPSNFAFKKLGPKVNAFLFSRFGLKYLKALLKYHIVVNQTLYTDAFYDASKDESVKIDRPPYYHFDLPTVLEGKPLAVDVARYGPFVEIRINGFSRVTVHDGVASDGVIQVVSDVLIPPKNGAGETSFWKGEEITVEDLMERLEPLVSNEENLEL